MGVAVSHGAESRASKAAPCWWRLLQRRWPCAATDLALFCVLACCSCGDENWLEFDVPSSFFGPGIAIADGEKTTHVTWDGSAEIPQALMDELVILGPEVTPDEAGALYAAYGIETTPQPYGAISGQTVYASIDGFMVEWGGAGPFPPGNLESSFHPYLWLFETQYPTEAPIIDQYATLSSDMVKECNEEDFDYAAHPYYPLWLGEETDYQLLFAYFYCAAGK